MPDKPDRPDKSDEVRFNLAATPIGVTLHFSGDPVQTVVMPAEEARRLARWLKEFADKSDRLRMETIERVVKN